ncbi:MAG: hypothetical protein OEN56_00395 [Gemmatimonadota bacterium]|nr:hypothetical protein [Gemmatimonadota bacterium]
MARKALAVVVGMLVVGVVVMILQQVAASIHPLPEGLDPMDPANADAFTAHLEGMPSAAWAAAFLSELIGAFLGAVAAGWIAGDRERVFSGVIVGLALLASVSNWVSFAHPTWFIGGQLVGYPVVLAAVWALLGKRRSTSPA